MEKSKILGVAQLLADSLSKPEREFHVHIYL